MPAARAIVFETPGDLATPFRLGRLRTSKRCRRGSAESGRSGADGYRFQVFAGFDERCIAKRTIIGVLEQEGATLRAYSYHWSVLRCGSSSGGTGRMLARPWVRQPRPEARECSLLGNPRGREFFEVQVGTSDPLTRLRLREAHVSLNFLFCVFAKVNFGTFR